MIILYLSKYNNMVVVSCFCFFCKGKLVFSRKVLNSYKKICCNLLKDRGEEWVEGDILLDFEFCYSFVCIN